MPDKIGVPTARSMGSAFGSYGVGIAGGLVYNLVAAFMGSGLLGSLAAPIAAGSVLKGTSGQIISVVAGFKAAGELLPGLFGNGGNRSSGRGVM